MSENTRFSQHSEDWAHRDSNPEPKDYAYHFGFRRRLTPCVVWTMPSPCRLRRLGGWLWPLHLLARSLELGSALGRCTDAQQAVRRSYTWL